VLENSEKALHTRMLARDPEAAEVIRACHAQIFRLLYQLCRDHHIAEDLTQETFAAAWASVSDYQGGSSMSTWLHRIAYCKFLDLYRRRCSV
jgi:RNA polymerase sigma-70 factor (ECF subfamily)